MVDNQGSGLDQIFHALSDGTRRSILERVLVSPVTVGELAEPFQMSLAAVSKHVVVLEEAHLVDRTRKGRQMIVSARPNELKPAMDLLQYYSTFWKRSLDSLEQFLLQEDGAKQRAPEETSRDASGHPPERKKISESRAKKRGPAYSSRNSKKTARKRRKEQ